MHALDLAQENMFFEVLYSALAELYPDAISEHGKQALYDSVAQYTHNALDLNIDNEEDVADFVDIQWRLGPNYWQDAGAESVNETLMDNSLDGEGKMIVIRLFYNGPDNELVKESSNPQASRSAYLQTRLEHVENPMIRQAFQRELDLRQAYLPAVNAYEKTRRDCAELDKRLRAEQKLGSDTAVLNNLAKERELLRESGKRTRNMKDALHEKLLYAGHANRIFKLPFMEAIYAKHA